MSSSVFGEDITTYAPGASTGMQTDALQFLENFTDKKEKKKKGGFKNLKKVVVFF